MHIAGKVQTCKLLDVCGTVICHEQWSILGVLESSTLQIPRSPRICDGVLCHLKDLLIEERKDPKQCSVSQGTGYQPVP